MEERIFITLGSQKFQFDRLLKMIDELYEKRLLSKQVFAQIGYSTYCPMHYQYKNFLDREEFIQEMEKADSWQG